MMTVNREKTARKTTAENHAIPDTARLKTYQTTSSDPNQIAVFCTNVIRREDADKLLQLCAVHFPDCACNFDLEDCDRIFRIRSQEDISAAVISLFRQYHFQCDILI